MATKRLGISQKGEGTDVGVGSPWPTPKPHLDSQAISTPPSK